MKYDVFLSHNSEDKMEVEQIALYLEKHELVPFLDKWHLIPGEPWQEALEEALSASSTCAVFIGPSGLSPWENEELRIVLDMRLKESTLRVIPVLLPGANPLDPKSLPPFLRRLSWVDLRAGLDDLDGINRLVAGIRGVAPQMENVEERTLDLSAGIIHPLPPAPYFTGRKRQLEAIKAYWNSMAVGIVSLIGIGGAGKTAIASEFVSALVGSRSTGYEHGELQSPEGCFVWSFYIDQSVESFLSQAFHYFSGGENIDARSSGAVYRLIQLLVKGGRHLLVLDGLERVQRPTTDSRYYFGEIEDSLLRQLVRRFAGGTGSSLCLVTSRFPLADVEVWSGRNSYTLNVDDLEMEDALSLMRRHDLQEPESVLRNVISRFGSHALTLDYLCTYAKYFCGGDVTALGHLEVPESSSGLRTERKLARILKAYEEVLTAPELDLLSRLCLFRFGTNVQTIAKIFAEGSKEIAGTLRGCNAVKMRKILYRLTELHLVLHEREDHYTTHPAVKDHFYERFRNISDYHAAIEIHFSKLVDRPGPEQTVDKEMLDVLEEIVYHAISAGAIQEAFEVYRDKMGGAMNLAYSLGDYARGIRVLQTFTTCPAPLDMATYLRALGEPEKALEFLGNEKPEEQMPALVLMGRLPEAFQIGKETHKLSRWNQVELLMKKPGSRANPCLFANRLDCLAHPHLAYQLGEEFRNIIEEFPFYSADYRIKGLDRNMEQEVRCSLSKAELDRQAGHTGSCETIIESVSSWILLSGSQELLCLLHLTTGRLARSKQNYPEARAALTEAIYLAKTCQFSLYFIDACNEMAALALELDEFKEVDHFARSALYGHIHGSNEPATAADLPVSALSIRGAEHSTCLYRWGALQAREMLRCLGIADQ